MARKSLGQNFLVDKNIIRKEVEYAGDLDTVLEIGCGTGLLTEELAKKARRVIAIEKDKELLDACKENLRKYDNIEYVLGDALRMDFPEFDKIVSDLPYAISSDITFKILEYDFELAVLTYQREFANRLVALPGERDYSRLSVNMYLRADVELLDDISRKCFYPMPKVDSVIVRIKKKKAEEPDQNILRALFQHKNKLIRNALVDSAHELDLEKKEARELFKGMPRKRVIDLTPEEMVELSGKVNELRK